MRPFRSIGRCVQPVIRYQRLCTSARRCQEVGRTVRPRTEQESTLASLMRQPASVPQSKEPSVFRPSQSNEPSAFRPFRSEEPSVSRPSQPKPDPKVSDFEDSCKEILDYNGAAVVLRDACKCPMCVDQSTSQREFCFADIPTNIRASSVGQDNQANWHVRWENDIPTFKDHVSIFTPSQINQIKSHPQIYHQSTTMLWDKFIFKNETSTIDYHDFMKSNVTLATALYLYARHGLVFVNNIPDDPDACVKLAERIGPMKNSFYGMTWNVKSVPNPINVAYTSKELGFHMDLLYMKEPPSVQFLHCIENSSAGGESRFIDTLKALDTLAKESPEHATNLLRCKIRYEYDNDGHYYTDVKPIVSMKSSVSFPRRKVRGTSTTFVNNVDRVYWGPQFMGSLWGELKEHPDLVQKKLQASNAFANILERDTLIHQTKLEAGTCAVFDNLRVLHARHAFDMNSGKRWLKGTYIDSQAALSKEMSLSGMINKIDQQMNKKHGTV